MKQATALGFIRSVPEMCHLCQTTMSKLEIHHIKPLKIGGTDDFDNLMLLCRTCHKAIEKTNRIHAFPEDSDILAQINSIAAREGVNQSVIVKRAIRFFLCVSPVEMTNGVTEGQTKQ
jgi:hypothetical protein